MRSRAASWGGSLLLHGALVVAALRCRPQRAPPVEPGTAAVELVPIAAPPRPVPVPAPVPVPEQVAPGRARAAGGGGQPRARPSRESSGSAIAGVEQEGSRSSTAGTGTGTGAGFGGGGLEGVTRSAPLPPAARLRTPTPPARSLARPARLIWPTRHRDERPGQVFVMSLGVDDDGYVIGVRLVRGVGGRDDDRAQAAVWRFRYDPARDAAGRPIASRVEQRFMLDE